MDKKSDAYQGLAATLRTWIQLAPLITELRGPYMRERHWNELISLAHASLEISAETKLSEIESLDLLALQATVEEITDKACARLSLTAFLWTASHPPPWQ